MIVKLRQNHRGGWGGGVWDICTWIWTVIQNNKRECLHVCVSMRVREALGQIDWSGNDVEVSAVMNDLSAVGLVRLVS